MCVCACVCVCVRACVCVCVHVCMGNMYIQNFDYTTDDYHSIQFKKNSDEVFKRAQELIHTGVSTMPHTSTCTN